MDEQLIALYNRHVGMAYDRQMRFAAFLEKKKASEEWEYDPATATLSFGKITFEAPLLGSHTASNNSWLWAWSNKHLKLTLTNRALGDAVRMMCHRLGVHQLSGPGFSLEPLLGEELSQSAAHILGVILSRELEYDAYQAFPNDGKTELILIRDDRLKVTEKHPLVHVAATFPEIFKAMPVPDHSAALAAYARDYGLTVTEAPGMLTISSDDKHHLTATFDEHNRLTKLGETVIPAARPPAKKPTKKVTKPAAKKVGAKPVAKKPTPKKPVNKKK